MAIIEATIDSTYIDSTLTNHAVGIRLDSDDEILSGLGATDYEGFHFTVNSVECYAEVELWDMTNEVAVFWVLVPSISSSSDTVITIVNEENDNSAYVGIIGSTPGQAVWDSNFVSVWHLSQDPSTGGACILESTSNANHGTPNGSMTSGDLVDMTLGKGLDFDGSDDYINIPHSSDFNFNANGYTEMTLEVLCEPAIVFSAPNNKYRQMLSKNSTYLVQGFSFHIFESSPFGRVLLEANIWNNQLLTTLGIGSANLQYIETYFAATTVLSTSGKLYVNGTEESIDYGTYPTSFVDNSYDLRIGDDAYNNANNLPWTGKIGEVRISKVSRSAAYIKAVANNLNGNLISKEVLPDVVPSPYNDYGVISINGKNATIRYAYILDGKKWREIDSINILINQKWSEVIIG